MVGGWQLRREDEEPDKGPFVERFGWQGMKLGAKIRQVRNGSPKPPPCVPGRIKKVNKEAGRSRLISLIGAIKTYADCECFLWHFFCFELKKEHTPKLKTRQMCAQCDTECAPSERD